jgi:lysophospholipase L1-like esterase
VPPPPVVDPGGAMTHFYERVAALLRGSATGHVRIAVFGDSNMTMDWITGELRRTLQGMYGDGGHGYVALGRPWEWYHHMDVKTGHDPRDWAPFAVSTRQSGDQCYGFGGIAARSQRAGAITWVETADAGSPIGTRASRFQLYYLQRPDGGAFDIRLDGNLVASIATQNGELEAGYYTFATTDLPHRVELISRTAAPSVVFGAALERDAPSIIVDSLGVGAVSGPLLLRQHPRVMKSSLRTRDYDLIVLLLGSNQVWPARYGAQMAELVARFREALPQVSILIMTPVDQVDSLKAWQSLPRVREVSEQNRKVAADNQCAFWDFRGAMGGEASMVRFILSDMGVADGIHLTQKGATYMGRRIAYALWRDLNRYLAEHPQAGCARQN